MEENLIAELRRDLVDGKVLSRWNVDILRPVVTFKCEVAFKSMTMEDQYFHYTLASWMVILGQF